MYRLLILLIVGVTFIPDVSCDCPRPAENSYVSTFINDRYPLRLNAQQNFPEGTILISRCKYVGLDRFHGSTERVCVEGRWSAPPPTCVPSESQIVIHTSAKVETSNKGSFIIIAEPKQKLTITCRVGEAELIIELYNKTATVPVPKYFRAPKSLVIHKLNPSHSGLYTCNDVLDDKSPPMEVEIIILEEAPMCTVPDAPQNGKRSLPEMNEVPMTTEIVYSCNKGYTLEGGQFTRCTSTGHFDADPPTCVSHLCQPPPPEQFKNGEVLGADHHVGSHIAFLCDDGFNIHGKQLVSVQCLSSVTWSDKFPKECRPNPTYPPLTTIRRRKPTNLVPVPPIQHSSSFSSASSSEDSGL